MNDFYRIPADARPAASLLLLRDDAGVDAGDGSVDDVGSDAEHGAGNRTGPAAGGLQVLMMVRSERGDGDVRSGAAVFPGGVLEPGDRDAHAWCLGGTDTAWSALFRLPVGALDYAVAAIRETFEEVGLLRVCAADGSALDLSSKGPLAAELATWRGRLQRGEASIAALCAQFDLRLDLRGLAYSAHWLTPPGMPKRWDTRFFTALAPQGQVATPDLGEAVAVVWTTPAAALDPAQGLKLLPAMRRMLGHLTTFSSAAGVMTDLAARAQLTQVPLTMPRVALHSRSGRRVVLPDELPYAEVGRLDPAGRGDVSCELLPGRAVQLSANVWRVTAPNPGPMTGPGTNSYLVGAGRDWTVIDPGPLDAAHTQALLQAASAAHTGGGRIVRVLVTHTHRDHSPGAVALAASTGSPVWGRLATHSEWQDDSFTPQHQPQHGEQIELSPGLVLRVLHTPGHASNHLCYLLESEQMLFTGDHVMQGSTVVINPPDGDMTAYLLSLQALLDIPLQWLAPGHGFLVDQPHAVLRRLIAHRLQRQAKVLAALQAGGGGSVQALLARVYDDVKPAMHGVAARSLTAHLLKLRDDGLASCKDGHWAHAGDASTLP